jgi:hypothetical protein
MYNRRAVRPDGAFHRNRRRSGLQKNTILEGAAAASSRGGLKYWMATILRRIIGRR